MEGLTVSSFAVIWNPHFYDEVLGRYQTEHDVHTEREKQDQTILNMRENVEGLCNGAA